MASSLHSAGATPGVLEILVGDPWSNFADEAATLKLFNSWLENNTTHQAAELRVDSYRQKASHEILQLEEIISAKIEENEKKVKAISSLERGSEDESHCDQKDHKPVGSPKISEDDLKWLQSHLSELKRAMQTSFDDEREVLLEYYERECRDHWRFFEALERHLHQPHTLKEQLICQIPESTMEAMTERYYRLDDDVMRELLAKKLTGASRKAVDDIAESTGHSQRTCRRQFDNLRRIATTLEDSKHGFQCYVQRALSDGWRLSTELAARYTCLLFIFQSGFKIINSRRSLMSFLTCHDFEFFASVLLTYWVQPSAPPIVVSASQANHDELMERLILVHGFELDKHLVSGLREIRTQVFSDKDTVLQELQNQVRLKIVNEVSHTFPHLSSIPGELTVLPPMSLSKLRIFDQKFRSLARSILSIGSHLAQLKEFRDLFEDITNKVVAPLLESGFTEQEVQQLFHGLYSAFEELGTVSELLVTDPSRHSHFCGVWKRFIHAVGCICLRSLERIHGGNQHSPSIHKGISWMSDTPQT